MTLDPSDPDSFEDDAVSAGEDTALDTSEPVGLEDVEVPEADAVEQHREVPVDEDEYREEEPPAEAEGMEDDDFEEEE